jgi:hypothetical protein
MNKIKADAIVGFKHNPYKQGEMFGKSRVYYKTSEKLQNSVDYNVIGYMEPSYQYNVPLKNFMHDFFFYPQMVKNAVRPDADLIHVFSQEEAYLLKFLQNNIPKVVSCLDIIPLIFKQEVTSFSTRFLKSFKIIKSDEVRFKKHFDNADKIIAISNSTKQDLIRYLTGG